MEGPQAVNIGGGRRRRALLGRRAWNNDEENVLLIYLKELVTAGWKSDNGFRGGYVNKLEELMRCHFPRSNIRANLHITSKLTGWKKNYGSLVYILGRSNVGFNLHGDFTIDCEDELWENICNVDPNAKNIRGKAWPFFDRWAEVFGKDRATRTSAGDVFDAVNDIIIEDNIPAPTNEELEAAQNQAFFVAPNTETDNSEPNSSRRGAGSSRVTKKRKIGDNLDKEMCEHLGQMQKENNCNISIEEEGRVGRNLYRDTIVIFQITRG